MQNKLILAVLIPVAVVQLAALLTAPRALRLSTAGPTTGPTIVGDPVDYLAAAEEQVAGLNPIIQGTEKRIRWFGNSKGQRTRYAIIYLHGFSATRQEIAPVGELIADQLGANLFETRLSGHGHNVDALVDVTAEDWLADAVESLAIGKLLGERLVVIGTSTGATLALAASNHELFTDVDSLIMISPNFAPRDGMAELLVWPGGPQLARLVLGNTRSWTAANDLQDKYWSTTYPVAALVEMMRLVKRVRSQLPMQLEQAVLTLYSPKDQVVSIDRLRTSIAQIDSPRLRTVEIPGSGDPANHVLAGNILAADNNETIVNEIVDFVTWPEQQIDE